MRALVHSELLKLRSTRMTAVLLLATLGLVALTIATNVPGVFDQNAALSLDDPDLLAGVVGVGFGVPLVMMALLGVIAFTQEFRYGTASSTYLCEPRRTRVLLAKWLSLALSSVVTIAAQFWQTVVAGLVVMAAYGVIGVALGALVRNQIAAVVGVLVWMLAVEQIVIPALPAVGRWMPWGATTSLLQLGRSYGFDGELLSAPMGGLLLFSYTATAVALALRFTPRRDVV